VRGGGGLGGGCLLVGVARSSFSAPARVWEGVWGGVERSDHEGGVLHCRDMRAVEEFRF